MSFSRLLHKAMAGPRALLLVIAMTAALAVPATALAGGFTARLSVPGNTHQPKVGNWRIKVTANRGSQKLSGTVSYRFLYQGIVVSKKPGGSFNNGVFNNTLLWPSKAVGHTITLQVVVATRYGTDYLNWWIKVRA
jgi:hypothetical protein